MRQITTVLKSSKIATLLAFGLAGLYAATEFGHHPSQLASASIPAKPASVTIPGTADDLKTASFSIPRPLPRPGDLPYVAQPYQIDVVSLTQKWTGMSYDIDSIRSGRDVPRYFVEHIPVDILDIRQVQTRKKVFLSVALPLILKVNEEILAKRNRLKKISAIMDFGLEPSEKQNEWLKQLAEQYDTQPNDLAELLKRVDTIPVSLALAQSIEESGWGTSRFARDGNALFGQRVWSAGNGLVPEEREAGAQYEVKVYDELLHSIQDYAHNLNRHNAYETFRYERARLKGDTDNAVSGYEISASLLSYSERGEAYIEALRSLMRVNKLGQFDTAKLAPEQFAQIFK